MRELENKYAIGDAERLILLLALAPHEKPDLLDVFISFIPNLTIVGGRKGVYHKGFIPTAQTGLFLLLGENNDLEKRKEYQQLFSPDHFFAKEGIISLENIAENEPRWSGVLALSPEWLHKLTIGKPYLPQYSTKFPAKRLTSPLDWEDLVLPEPVMKQLTHIQDWLRHQEFLLKNKGLGKMFRPGYRALFFGAPGTGKTLSVTLLGKALDMPVYRIDLSQVVSKYIGETEKNLANIFDQAENKNWILFFDEGEALFGKRSATSDSKDRYANQEIAYLLQRVEEFNGLVILATNRKEDMDKAFLRRFESTVLFRPPNYAERLELWMKAFKQWDMSQVSWEQLAQDYFVSGGMIVNVLRYVSIRTASRKSEVILLQDLVEGIKMEYEKQGKDWTPDRLSERMAYPERYKKLNNLPPIQFSSLTPNFQEQVLAKQKQAEQHEEMLQEPHLQSSTEAQEVAKELQERAAALGMGHEEEKQHQDKEQKKSTKEESNDLQKTGVSRSMNFTKKKIRPQLNLQVSFTKPKSE